jgi:hypothetical protein
VRYDYRKHPGFLKMGQGFNSIKIYNAMELLTEIPRTFEGSQTTGFLISVPDPKMSNRDVWDYVVDQLGDNFKTVASGSDAKVLHVNMLYIGQEVQFRTYAGSCSGHKACNLYRHPAVERQPDDMQHEYLAASLKEHREQEVYLPMKWTIS